MNPDPIENTIPDDFVAGARRVFGSSSPPDPSDASDTPAPKERVRPVRSIWLSSSVSQVVFRQLSVKVSWPTIGVCLVGTLLLALAVLEPASAVWKGRWMDLAALGWLLLLSITFLLSWIKILDCAAADFRRREWLPLLVLAVAAWICFSSIAGDSHVAVNREATQEVASGLESWRQPGFGYHLPGAFLGGNYPSRQYLMIAAPSLWLGRGLLPLRLGFALLFFTGFSMFMVGLRAWWTRELLPARDARLFAALAGAILLTFPIVIAWLRQYEQTSIPISLVMLSMGWLAVWLSRPTSFYALPLAWVVGMLGTCYTPGLAAWALFLLLTIALAGRQFRLDAWKEGALLATVALYSFSMCAVAIWNFRALMPRKFSTVDAISETALTSAQLTARLADGFQAVLAHPALPYVHPTMLFLFLAHFAWLGTRRPSGRNGLYCLIWLWAATTVIAALVVRGYCYRPPAFDLHRSMVAIPLVVFVATEFAAISMRSAMPVWRSILRAGGVALLVVAVGQCWQAIDPASDAPFQSTLEANLAEKALGFAKRLPLAEDSPFAIVLPPGTTIFPRLIDLTWYFAPNAQIYHEPLEAFLRTNGGTPFIALMPASESFPAGLESGLLPVRTDLPSPQMRLIDSGAPAN